MQNEEQFDEYLALCGRIAERLLNEQLLEKLAPKEKPETD